MKSDENHWEGFYIRIVISVVFISSDIVIYDFNFQFNQQLISSAKW